MQDSIYHMLLNSTKTLKNAFKERQYITLLK